MLHCFDLDKTLIEKNGSFAFCLYLWRIGFFSSYGVFRSLVSGLKFEWGRISLRELHERVFGLMLKGTPLTELTAHVGSFLDSFLFRSLYAPAFEALKRAEHFGEKTMLLSSSPDFIVIPIAERLGIPIAQGTVYAVDKEGKLCHIAELMEGRRKALRLAETAKSLQIPRSQIIVYSDSHHDLPLFEEAGEFIAVNPDSRLRHIARKKNWSIL